MPRADDSAAITRPMSLWPEAAASAQDTQQAGFAMTAFDPQQAQHAQRRARVAAQLALCQPALALRVAGAVQLAVGLGALVPAQGWRDALVRWPGPALAALGATLGWLALVCGARGLLARWPLGRLRGAMVAAGGLAGLAGWALLLPLGLATAAAWPALASAAAGAVAAGAIVGWLRLRDAAAQPVEAHARLAELQSRIRPHFLFNALNTALALVSVDPVRAEAVLEDLSTLFRAALAESGSAVSLDEELELAQRYLAIEQIRFARRLSLVWDLDPAAAGARLPPLVLQPLVENAVRHGVEPSADGGVVTVRTRVHRGMAEVEVVNTLPDEPGEPGLGMALANVRERLRLLHDLGADLHTWVQDNHHHARITVPL